MNFKEFYTKGIAHHLKQRKRLDSQILLFVIHTYKDGKLKISPVVSYGSSPMDHAQGIIDKLAPDMYLVCAETWMHKTKDIHKYEKNYEYGQISAEKEKMECIVFIAKTRNGKDEHTEPYEIIRNDKGKITDYKLQDWGDIQVSKLK